MSIPYVVRKKVYTTGEEKKELWHAVIKKVQRKGGVTEDDLAWMISNHTSFSKGEIRGIIIELVDTIEKVLSEGQSVTIKNFGSFQTAVTSKGFEQPEEVTPGEVSVSKVYFIADRGMSHRLKQVPCIQIPLGYYLPEDLLLK